MVAIMDSHKKIEKIRVLQWNCCTIRGKKDILNKLLGDFEIDIFAISETRLAVDDSFYLKNYDILTESRDTRNGGVMLGIHKSLKWSGSVKRTVGILEQVGAEILIGNLRLYTTSNYIPPGAKLSKSIAQKIFDHDGYSLNIGDFNAYSHIWGSNREDARGKLTVETAQLFNQVILNDGSVTRMGYVSQRDSALDLAFISADMALDTSWKVLEGIGGQNGSDHLPILIEISMSQPITRDLGKRKIDLTKNISWTKYQENLIAKGQSYEGLNVTEQYEKIMSDVKSAAIEAQTKPIRDTYSYDYREPTEWWDKDCDALFTQVKFRTKIFHQTGLPVDFEAMQIAEKEFIETTR